MGGYFLELVLAKNILEALGYNWVLYFVIALVVVFLRLLASGLPDDDYRIIYRP